MYRRLTIILSISLATSVFIVIAELIIQATDDTDKQFRSSWLWDGYWQLVYCLCILFVSWVWRPNDDNKRFAYLDTQEDEPPKPTQNLPDDKTVKLDPETVEPRGETIPSYDTSLSDSDSETESSGFDPDPDRKISKVKLETSDSTSSSDED